MPLIKNILINLFILFFLSTGIAQSEDLKKIGKFKDWDVMVLNSNSEKVCFAQTKPVLQSPKGETREARLFVSFRPKDKVVDEISTTSGYEYNTQNSIRARSGKN